MDAPASRPRRLPRRGRCRRRTRGCWRRSSGGPVDAGRGARPLDELDRLLDPAPLPVETGWCTLPDGVGYVAVRTPMPGVSGEMVDWWFDWHPATRSATGSGTRRRISTTRSSRRPSAGAKAHWGTVHHPVEDVGVGKVRARIEFLPPDASSASRATRSRTRGGDDRLRLRSATTPAACATRRWPTSSCAERRRRRAAQPLLARRRDPPLPARRRSAAPVGAGAQQPASCAGSRFRAGCRGRSPPTAPRSTRTSRPCFPSCTGASLEPDCVRSPAVKVLASTVVLCLALAASAAAMTTTRRPARPKRRRPRRNPEARTRRPSRR